MKKLLFAMLCIVSALGLRAQTWTSPGSDPVNDGQYYILNVEAGQFITAANDWKTQLSATGTDTGLLIKTQAVSNVTVAGASLSGWELLNTNNNSKLLFRDSERWGFTDKGDQDRGYVWNITKVNGVYRLQTAAGDPAYPAASTQYAGANASLNGARVYFGYNSSSSDIDWMFLTEDQKGTANIVAKARLYRALMKAYAAGVNTEEASAVYENSSSTAEEMNSAVSTLNNACLTAHLDNASDADPRDITEFVLRNSDFTQGNITGWETNYVGGKQATNIGYQDNKTYQSDNGFVNKFIEAWRSGNAKIGDGYLRQTVSNMPEGKYVLECDAIATNQGNTSATTKGALLYINADGVDFTTSLSTNGSAVQHFSTEFLFTGEGDVIFGLKTQSTTANWIAADNFKVTYYGIDLSAYKTQLAAAVAAFETLEGTVPTTTYNTKKTSVVDVYNKEWRSSKEYSTAIAAIQTATSELNALAPGYAEYQAVRTAVLNTYNSTDVTSADASANSAATVEELNVAIAAVRTALKTAITANNLENVDLTAALLINPSFETGNFTGWENTGMSVQGNDTFGKVGTYYAECWTPDGIKSIAQTLSGMPAGVYKVTATIKARGVTSAELSAGGVSKAMTISDDQIRYTVEFACDADADITIKYEGVGTKANQSWLCADDFTLTYVGALPDVTAVEGKMNAEVATAQTNAINAYNSDQTVANYNAVQSAIAAAQTSKDAYAKTATAIADAKTLGANFNFATAAATTTFNEAVTAVETAYNDGTLEDASAKNCANLGTVLVGWHPARSSENYTIAEAYMKSAWTGGELNDWSTEGDTDGSNFHVPFFQNWIDNANSLTEGTTFGQLTGLDNGLYRVSAQVRVRIKNGQEAGTAPSGITLKVNNGSEVNVCAGGQIGESQFYLGTFEAEGLVRDGTLNAIFTRADGNNVSWLSFKNVQYTRVRDLTPAEEAPAIVEDYVALNTAIANAEAKTLGFDEGDYAPYNNITVLAALAAAKAINQEGDNAHDDVVAATNAIADSEWNANVEEVNAVYDGTFAAATNNGAPKGWRMSNNTLGGDFHSRAYVGDTRLSEFNGTNSGLFLRFDGTNSDRGSMYYYGDTKNYTMPLKKDVTYYAKVDFTNWGTSSSKPLRMYVTGPDGFTATGLTVNSTKNAETGSDTPDQILFVFTPNVAGNYVINFQCPGSDDNKHNVVISNVEVKRVPELALSEDVPWTPVAYPAANVTLARTIAADKWSTFVVPFNIDNATLKAKFGDDVQVSEFSANDKTGVTFTPMAEPAITANEPVLMKTSTNDESFTFEGVVVSAGTATISENGVNFVGNYNGLITIPNALDTYYVNSNTLKKSNGTQKLKGFRAYFTVDADSPVKAFFEDGINLDVTDAINALEAADTKNALIYNLAGQRLQKMQRGINIVNGKKVLVK